MPFCPGQVAWLGHHPIYHKVAGLIPDGKTTDRCFFHINVSFSFTLSMKKISSDEKRKKNYCHFEITNAILNCTNYTNSQPRLKIICISHTLVEITPQEILQQNVSETFRGKMCGFWTAMCTSSLTLFAPLLWPLKVSYMAAGLLRSNLWKMFCNSWGIFWVC